MHTTWSFVNNSWYKIGFTPQERHLWFIFMIRLSTIACIRVTSSATATATATVTFRPSFSFYRARNSNMEFFALCNQNHVTEPCCRTSIQSLLKLSFKTAVALFPNSCQPDKQTTNLRSQWPSKSVSVLGAATLSTILIHCYWVCEAAIR